MKHRFIIELGDYMDNIIGSEPHMLSSEFIDQEDNRQIINVLSNEMFASYFEYFFYSYQMISFKELTDEEVINKFNMMWRIFQIEEKENLKKLVQGYYWDYVPVYNYDRTERWTDTRTGNEKDERRLDFAKRKETNKTDGSFKETNTETGGQTTTDTPSGSFRETMHNAEVTGTDKVSTFDSDSFNNKEQNITSQHEDYTDHTYNQYQEESKLVYDNHKNEVDHTFNNYQTTREDDAHLDKDDNTHTYNNVKDTHEGRMFGNIGVTTNVDMIGQEFELRVHELGYEFMKRFFDKFFVML